MKAVSLAVVVTFSAVQLAYGQQYLGTYTTKPELFPEFAEPFSEEEKKLIEMMTLGLQIKESELIVQFGPIPGELPDDPIRMKYSVEGKFLLGIDEESRKRRFVPFYVENEDTIHGFGNMFYRRE